MRPGVRLNWKFFSPYMAVTVNRPDQKRNTLDKMALIFDAVDTNEDGLISQEEFEVCLSHFSFTSYCYLFQSDNHKDIIIRTNTK